MRLFILTVLLALVVSTQTSPSRSRIYMDSDVKTDPEHPMEGPYFEGDMRLTEEEVEQLLSNKVTPVNTNPWTKGNLYYVLDTTYTPEQRINITTAVSLINNELPGCIRIEERPTTLALENYVFVYKGDGCNSAVGMQGGRQELSVNDACVTVPGKVAHEFIHALGFAHEQTRPDRDRYVKFHCENLDDPKHEHNFRRYDSSEVEKSKLPYDYESIMHYGPAFFGKYVTKDKKTVRLTTLEVLDKTKTIGQEEKLSKTNIKMIREKYGCK